MISCNNQLHWKIKQRIQLAIIVVIVFLKISLGSEQAKPIPATATSTKSNTTNIITFDTSAMIVKFDKAIVKTGTIATHIRNISTAITQHIRSEATNTVVSQIRDITQSTISEAASTVVTQIRDITQSAISEAPSTVVTEPIRSETTVTSTSDNIDTTITSAIIHTAGTTMMAERISKSVIIVESTMKTETTDNFNTILYKMTSGPDISQKAVKITTKLGKLV